MFTFVIRVSHIRKWNDGRAVEVYLTQNNGQ